MIQKNPIKSIPTPKQQVIEQKKNPPKRSQSQQHQQQKVSEPKPIEQIQNIIKKPLQNNAKLPPQGPPKKSVVKGKNIQLQEEEQKQQPKQGLFTEKPSAKLTGIKTIDPFADKKNQKTNSFAYVYNAGGIPCRVNHGTFKMKLQWNPGVTVETLSYDPLLATCFDGLIEEGHPYNFIALTAIKEMLECEGCEEKVIPLVTKLVWPLRNALSSKSESVFDGALQILKLLSNTVGSHLNPHVKNLVVPLTKRMDKKFKEPIYDCLHSLEENGGPEAYKTIKSAIPTYSNM